MLASIAKLVSIATGLFDFFDEDDTLTVGELNAALSEAVDEIITQTRVAIEESELQSAQNLLELAFIDLQEYRNELTEEARRKALAEALTSAKSAWAALNNQLDLISEVKPGLYGPVTGDGLLGHPLFMVAASLWATVNEEKIRKAVSLSEAEATRKNLRDICLGPSVEAAEGMQSEWVRWTRDRFSPLIVRKRQVGPLYPIMGTTRFRWVYFFNGQKYIAEQYLVDLDFGVLVSEGPEAAWAKVLKEIDQTAEKAFKKYYDHVEAEVNTVVDAFVNPSAQVVEEWRQVLDEHQMSWVPQAVAQYFADAQSVAELAHQPYAPYTSYSGPDRQPPRGRAPSRRATERARSFEIDCDADDRTHGEPLLTNVDE